MTRTLRKLGTVLLAALPLAGCARNGAAAPEAGAPVQGKTVAPVSIEARAGEGTMRLVFRFLSPSSGVDISVNGIGLTVTSETALVQNGTFERGTAAEYDVSYTPGEGRSTLAVSVKGIFGGQPRARVATFPVGEPTAEQQKPSGPAPVEQGGDAVKLLPGDAKP